MTKIRFLITYLLLTNFLEIDAKELSSATRIESKQSLYDPRNITPLLFDDNQNVTPALRELFQITGVDCNSLTTCLKETQTQWVAVVQGRNGKERRDLVDLPQFDSIKPRVIQIIEEFGLLNNQPPLQKHYDYAVCLGAFMETARSRLAYLIQAWKNGVRFDELIFLGSHRPLRNGPGQIEEFRRLCDPTQSTTPFRSDWCPPQESEIVYKTEHDMHLLIWEQADIPDDMRQHLKGRVVFVNTPDPDSGIRASTYDTYRFWIENNSPSPGSILAASSPGIWCYQHLSGLNAVGERYQLETFAPRFENKEELTVIVILDTMAKCIYEALNNRDQLTNYIHQ